MPRLFNHLFLFLTLGICLTLCSCGPQAPKGTVIIETSEGEIQIQLYDETPLHKANFIKLIKEGYYNDLLFHRVIKDFMIQGGDPDSKGAPLDKALGNGGPGYDIPAEIIPGKFHKRGALAAARLGDEANPEQKSSGSQFYIVQGRTYTLDELHTIEEQKHLQVLQNLQRAFLNKPENNWYKDLDFPRLRDQNPDSLKLVGDQMQKKFEAEVPLPAPYQFDSTQLKLYTTIGGAPFLDGAYTVFGEVIKGLDVIDKIGNRKVGVNDRPAEDIKMKITIIE